MAIVTPVTENRQELAPVTRSRHEAANFNGPQMIAQGLQSLARGTGELADEAQRLRLRDAETAARDADNQRQQRVQALLREGDRAYFNLTNRDALNSRASFNEDIVGITNEIGAGLTDRFAQEMYRRVVERRQLAEREQMDAHENQERERYEQGVYTTGLAIAASDAAANWSNPAEIERNILTVQSSVAQRQAAIGVTDEAIVTQTQRAAVAEIVQGVAGRLRVERGPLEAQAFIRTQEQLGRLDEVAATRMLTALDGEAAAERADGEIEQYLVFDGPPPASEGGTAGDPGPVAVGRPTNEGNQPPRYTVQGFTIGDGYGAGRRNMDGTARPHTGVDMFAPAGTQLPLYRPYTIVRSWNGGPQAGNKAQFRFDDGSVWEAMHLPDLPRAGRYAAGRSPMRSGSTGNADAASPHIHLRPVNDRAQAIYNRGRRATTDYLFGSSSPTATTQTSSPEPTGDAAISTFMQRVVTHESGGDPNIPNRTGSTAQGLYQFTDPTWISYYRRLHPDQNGMSDAQILARRYDRTEQRNVMQTAAQDYARTLRSAPGGALPVTPTNLYLVHNFGPEAVRILRADPSRPLRTILSNWDVIDARNPDLNNSTTAGQIIARRAQQMGSSGGAAATPVETVDTPAQVNLEATIERINARTDLPYNQRQALIQAAGRRDTLRRNTIAGQQQALQDQVARELIPLGDNFTSVDQLSLQTRAQLQANPRLMLQVTEQARTNQRANERIAAGERDAQSETIYNTMLEASYGSAAERQRFLGLNPFSNPQLTAAQQRSVAERQNTVRREIGRTDGADERIVRPRTSQINRVVGSIVGTSANGLPRSGSNRTDEQVNNQARLRVATLREVERVQREENRTLNDEEVMQIARGLTEADSGGRPAFRDPAVAAIQGAQAMFPPGVPPGAAQQIVESWRRLRPGQPISSADIVRIYNESSRR
jgi:murein DD-endopeptidase MepM/ murein hydrolase activator NlpD